MLLESLPIPLSISISKGPNWRQKWGMFEENLGRWSSCPPGTVRLATPLSLSLWGLQMNNDEMENTSIQWTWNIVCTLYRKTFLVKFPCIKMFWSVRKIQLTAHNWQKWKRVFLTCPCHKIYRDETVGLKSCKYTWKIMIFVKMWNLEQYLEKMIFCQ